MISQKISKKCVLKLAGLIVCISFTGLLTQFPFEAESFSMSVSHSGGSGSIRHAERDRYPQSDQRQYRSRGEAKRYEAQERVRQRKLSCNGTVTHQRYSECW